MAEVQAPEEAQFQIHKLFIKDLTFEIPGDVSIYNQEWKPELNVDIDHKSKVLDEKNTYEVVLTAKCTVKSSDKIAFYIEIHQGGVFEISNLADEQLKHALGAFCPNVLYPYLREAVSDVVQKGGFPQLMLAPINFDMLFEQQMAKTKEEEPKLIVVGGDDKGKGKSNKTQSKNK